MLISHGGVWTILLPCNKYSFTEKNIIYVNIIRLHSSQHLTDRKATVRTVREFKVEYFIIAEFLQKNIKMNMKLQPK